MKTAGIVPIENLGEEPYASVLCYPQTNGTELQARLKELQEHNITALEFTGGASVCNVPVLGKGFVGVTVVAHLREQRVALKIRRVDADRTGLQHEAAMLAKANLINVGPEFISASTNFLLMQFVDGMLLPKWLEMNREKTQVRRVLRAVLEQCWQLDSAGLDHGELARAQKHVIVSRVNEPYILDFESASSNRRTANVTGMCQYLFVGSSYVARLIADVLGERCRGEIIEALRRYKRNRTRESFYQLLRICFIKS